MTDGAKTNPGNFFEDFAVGQEIEHATPRTVSEGDVALYMALTGSRFAVNCADTFAIDIGLPQAPLDDTLVFNIVFGKTVPDISLNAVANLGYADGRFFAAIYPGDTISASSTVIGLKENSNRKTGVVYVRTTGRNQMNRSVLEYVRWVMVNKRDPDAPAPEPVVPELPEAVPASRVGVPGGFKFSRYDFTAAGSQERWDDYEPGERIDHVDAMTIEEADHMAATRLYQNTARVHFNEHTARAGRFGKRIVYGGHVISIARSLSFNGLANAVKVAAINGGRHVAPTFAGDTIYAWSEILEKHTFPSRDDVGLVRVRTVATKDQDCASFPDRDDEGNYHPAVVLDIDYTVLMPRR